jgi:hypothetical protein
MKNNQKALYNEPVIQREGDVVPSFSKIEINSLPELVKVRLQIESQAMLCPVGDPSASLPWTNVHKQVVTMMLGESDSPLSCRLRANAAGLAGQLGLAAAAPVLHKICLNKTEDLHTRVNSIGALVKLAEIDRAVEVPTIFKTREPAIRLAAYRATLNSGSEALHELGKGLLAKETNKDIVAVINKTYKPGPDQESTIDRKKR